MPNQKNHKRTPRNFDNFMTEKERNYVSSIFQKNILRTNKIYNYSMFYDEKPEHANDKSDSAGEYHFTVNKENNRKLINELEDLRLEKSERFDAREDSKPGDRKNGDGKSAESLSRPARHGRAHKISFIKSVKLPRLMMDVDIPVFDDLAIKLKIEAMIDAFMCQKYVIKESNLNNLIVQNSERMGDFFKVAKFQKLVKEIFESGNEGTKKILLLEMLRNSQYIRANENMSALLDYLVAYVPNLSVEEIRSTSFFDNFMFGQTGVLLATLLLINQETLAPHFYQHLRMRMEYLISNELRYVWRFLALMVINLGDRDKKWIVVRLKDKILEVAVSNNMDDISDMSLFLDALGLNSEDIS
ncbi:hypothetical protein THOM_1290 [Trachipleistophora hominis]|uniref:Uncharacterized protein n=1 Tax=Trachipleistophora hominis TaxID=72359 RepID=L7JYF2_TRAHO|nr:hypothetical protein THOM_1290 [Trachipleistophora hominis]